MSSPLGGVLAIDEGIVFLTILISVGKGHLYIVTLKMYDRIEGVTGHTVFQQILQSMTREYSPTIIHYCQSNIKICIITEHILHNLIMELIVMEHRWVGLEIYKCAVLVL